MRASGKGSAAVMVLGYLTLVAAATEQLGRLTLTSRAFHNDRLGPFADALAALCGKDMVLPMNTGAEAVESAIKVARKWGYEIKGVADGKAEIDGNHPLAAELF